MASPAELKHMLKNDRTGLTVFWSGNSPVRIPGEPAYALIALPSKSDKRLGSLTWHELPLLTQLGIKDILYATPDHSQNSIFGVGGTNATLELFTTECIPASPSFGKPEKSVEGGVLFKWRNDKKMMKKCELEPIELFIEERLAAIRAALPDIETAKLEHDQMTPKALKKVFKEYIAENAARYKDMGWVKVSCPVVLDQAACEQCGIDEVAGADSEAMLKKCGKCKKVLYCSKECQASDWKAHKPFCKA